MAFIAQLPPALQEDAFTREQALLAESKRGEHELAIAGLKQLIELQGETPERLGLIGGSGRGGAMPTCARWGT